MKNTEKRYLKHDIDTVYTRAYKDEAGNKVIEGYASVFSQKSKLLFENDRLFYEIIEPAAFDQVLLREDLDVLLTYQHNSNEVLARFNPSKGVNTLGLFVDEKGLKFRAILPNTTAARDTWENISAGNLYECSFVFTVAEEGERWEKDIEGNNIRYITDVTGLYDVSVVVNGAYSNTDVAVAMRSLERFEESLKEVEEEQEATVEERSEIEVDKMLLEVLKLKM
jgi:HK97 family phage prohead protease